MLACLAASCFCGSTALSSLSLQVVHGSDIVYQAKLNLGEKTAFDLNENHTLRVQLETRFESAPKSHVIVFEQGTHSVSFPFNFRQGQMTFAFAPSKLKKLYKHGGPYSLRLMVADPSMEHPVFWTVADVNYITENEVVDNFTDVEWDFQPAPRTPPPLVTKVFTILMIVPFVILIFLLLVNGCNLGYFPKSFFDAIASLLFVIALGCFFVFFVYFWRALTFETMFKYLLVIVPVLGLLLRRALIGRAKMAIKDHVE